MRSNTVIWWIIAVFFALVATMYIAWNILAHPGLPLTQQIEWVGATALAFSSFMAIMIAFYLGRVHKAQGGELESDMQDADIDDGDPEVGEFAPWSWWPLVLAASASVFILGLAVGTFLLPIGVAIFAVAIVGWVYEYYRGYFAR